MFMNYKYEGYVFSIKSKSVSDQVSTNYEIFHIPTGNRYHYPRKDLLAALLVRQLDDHEVVEVYSAVDTARRVGTIHEINDEIRHRSPSLTIEAGRSYLTGESDLLSDLQEEVMVKLKARAVREAAQVV